MARAISSSLAPIVEQLELDGDVIVTPGRIAEVLRGIGSNADANTVAYELQRAGWLGSLRTRGAWEFLPGARGGAYSSGDRFLEFRAQRQRDPNWPGVLAMESAASLLGLAQRLPEREVVSLPAGVNLPKAFAGQWRSTSVVMPPEGCITVDRLPVWNREGLVTGIAASPAGYRDIPGLAQWLGDVVHQVDISFVIILLKDFPRAVSQRAAYLLRAGGNSAASSEVMKAYPPKEVAWLGKRTTGGKFDPHTRVHDTALRRYLSVGVGA